MKFITLLSYASFRFTFTYSSETSCPGSSLDRCFQFVSCSKAPKSTKDLRVQRNNPTSIPHIISQFYIIIATMMAESVTKVLFHQWPLILLIISILYLLKNRFNRGLNKYPGPFVASLTDWWRFWDVYQRRPEVTHIKLHAKHGDVVRLGPNVLSFASPKALKAIYGLNKGFTKVRVPCLNLC